MRIGNFVILALLSGIAASAASLTLDHNARITYDFALQHVSRWSGGALVNFVSNETAAPTLLSFDEQGNPLQAFPFIIPDAEKIDLDDIARSPDGVFAVCGSVFERGGKRSGFIGLVDSIGQPLTTVRLFPYHPDRISFASDGTIWTKGVEAVNGKEPAADYNIVRHFDRGGKLLGSFIPRSSLASVIMAMGGHLASAKDRVGWYNGPNTAGYLYYEVLSDGTVHKYPPIALNKYEQVTGLALTDDGSAFATTSGTSSHPGRFLSIAWPAQQWTGNTTRPDELVRAFLYGSDGERLVFCPHDRFSLAFATVKP